MMTEEQVMNRVLEHSYEVTSLGYDYFFVSAQGSWNYDLGYENSDVDTKATLFPNFDDFALNKKPVSTTHILLNNEHIDLKDIRFMFDCFWKQNVNFLEVLFSKYFIVNPNYKEEWNQLLGLRERIAHYNNWYAVKCMYGMATEKYFALEKLYPSQMKVVKKYGYSGKQLHHLMRMVNFITAYSNEYCFEECLTCFPVYGKEALMAAKRQEFSLESARHLAEVCMEQMKELRDKYILLNPHKIDEQVKAETDELLCKLLRKNFLNQLKNK